MRSDLKNQLERQAKLGIDKGMRLQLRWESGFTITVHSWEAAAVITKRGLSTRKNSLTKASAFRQNFYAGEYDEGIELLNPETFSLERCFLVMVEHAKRGAPRDPEVTERKKKELRDKIAKLERKTSELKQELATL